MKTPQTPKKIEAKLRAEFAPSYFALEDQSHHHVGHNPAGGGGHYFVEIHSARFQGVSPLERQRMVMSAVQELMDLNEIHALSLRCVPSS